jgi:hypothetical protein
LKGESDRMFSSSTLTTLKWTVTSVIMFSLGTLWYSGLFSTFKFSLTHLKKNNKAKLWLKGCYRGRYRDAANYVRKLEKELKYTNTVVIFWDDPRIVGENRCRFSVGIVLEQDEIEGGELLKEKLKDWIPVQQDTDLEAIYTSLPYTNSLSNIIAAARVYPAWVEECKRLGKGHGPIVKITNKSKGFIEFYFLTMPPPPSFAKSMEYVTE